MMDVIIFDVSRSTADQTDQKDPTITKLALKHICQLHCLLCLLRGVVFPLFQRKPKSLLNIV